jgi:hypothetical protein
VEKSNWLVSWANDFRQNVQDKGLFDAPDATVFLSVDCGTPVVAEVSVRNIGLASLPAGVDAAVFAKKAGGDIQVGQVSTTHPLSPGQTETLTVTLDPQAASGDTFVARILVDPASPKFHECRDDNDESATAVSSCVH